VSLATEPGTETAQQDHAVAVAPGYMARFSCLGGDCPEHCCGGWSVSVSRATFETYQTVPADHLRRLLQEHVRARQAPSSERAYAEIASAESGRCGLLTHDGWCRIHRELGEDLLPQTRRDFPRLPGTWAGRPSLVGTMACPEVARLALQDAASSDLIPWPKSSAAPAPNAADKSPPMQTARDPMHDCAAAIANAARELVLRPAMPVRFGWQYMLWTVTHAVDAVREEANPATAAQTIREVLASNLAPGVAESLARAAGDGEDGSVLENLRLVRAVSAGVAKINGSAPSLAVLRQAVAALGFEAEDTAGSVQRYRELRRRWYEPFVAAHPHVPRNWLLNNLLLHDYPNGSIDTLPAQTLGLLLRFTLFETLAVGRAAQRGEAFGVPDCVRVAHALARHVEHESAYRGTPLMGQAS
jgi:lysine-N-methylase